MGEVTPVVCVVGPTASGKSDLAQELAVVLDGEVVSADSMQIYKGMDIGTGKILPLQQKVPHFGIDLCEPGEPYSAALFQAYARECFQDIASREKHPILCGGTGFYVRSAIDDYDFPPGKQEENPLREKYTHFAEEFGGQALWDLLDEKDPASAAIIHPHNTRRIIRAFELLEEGASYATQKQNLQSLPQAIPAYFLGLAVDPQILNERIDKRIDAMLEAGLLEEVQGLLNQGFRLGLTAPQAIGYKELVAYLEGETSFEEAVESIRVATHRYAKRQRTWFRKDKRIQWLHADSGDTADLVQQARRALDTMSERN